MTQSGRGFERNDQGSATFGGVELQRLLAKSRCSTPVYFYDLSGIESQVRSLSEAFGSASHLIAYAVKANSSASVIRTITEAGAGVDAVSGGELMLARHLGVPSRKIVLSGVAKRDDEIDLALAEDLLALQCESVGELSRVAERAKLQGRRARVSIRINPSVEIDSHSHIATGHDAAKFGTALRDLPVAFSLIAERSTHLSLVGMSTHVGSMLKKPNAYLDSARAVCVCARDALTQGHHLEYVDFGGGFGIDYGDGPAAPPAQFATQALALLNEEGLGNLKLVVEPGRSLVGAFGILVSKVIQEKSSGQRRWLMIDAGMNDLLRPALYQASHRIEDIDVPPGTTEYQVVGPVCESTDDFGPHSFSRIPSYVVLRDAGAYAFTMASEYNARPLPAEVFVKGGVIVHENPSPGVNAWVESRLRA